MDINESQMKDTSNNHRHHRGSPITGVLASAGEVASDFVELVELQIDLTTHDVRSLGRRAMFPVVTLVMGATVSIAALPVLSFGLAGWLEEATTLNGWSSKLFVGAILFVIALVSVIAAIIGLRSAFGELRSTTTEFRKNLTWLKEMIRGSE